MTKATGAELARQLGFARSIMRVWHNRYDDFPGPEDGLYDLEAVHKWGRKYGHIAKQPGHIYDHLGNDVTDKYKKIS